ncbi:UDP-glucuronosyl/UDP-glucosyltransferase [Corchorus capsularis]|uniref:Glycosyltransferase n=1 Tax=Corchorus capsularis TaxID=210143 RepID=A0A1R3HUP7_COCAP|nr:UDP-glucuronosyl/UDP-glucosyltransferase [Corchorus capsularis]
MGSTDKPLVHVFLVSFPGQGHVNPLLRLGKRLASKGLLVTLSTTEGFGKQMAKVNNITDEPARFGDGFIRFEFFKDGLDEDDSRRGSLDQYMAQLELVGREEVSRMIKRYEEQNRPVSCLINNPFIPWASDVAESLNIPSAMLWVQSCASFAAYYHYNNGSVPFPTETDPEIDVQLPAMPLLKHDEIPSFLHPSTPYGVLGKAILGQFKNLNKPFCVLMDTFQELEHELVEYMSKFCPVRTVGPLFMDPSPKVITNTVRCDMMKADDVCIEWLDSKPPSSVVYISFGSIVHLKQEQVDELAHALLNTGLSFLWVMKPPLPGLGLQLHTSPEGFLEKVGDKGKIVNWSPQEKVLTHPSVSCFLSHCGWNSTTEALSSGMPIIAFPQWGDQVTDAVYLVDVFKTGVRMCRGEAEGRIIPREEVEKCLREATGGPKAVEMKENALKWKEAAEAAVADGGSSDRNIQDFIDEVKRRSTKVDYAAATNFPTKSSTTAELTSDQNPANGEVGIGES